MNDPHAYLQFHAQAQSFTIVNVQPPKVSLLIAHLHKVQILICINSMKNKIFWSEQNIYSSPQRVSLKVSSGVTESAYSLSSLVCCVFMKLIKSLNYESARRHDKN